MADFDPDNIKTNVADHSEDHDTFEVTFERSDAAIKIEDDVENWDGEKSKLYFSSESVIMDSDESARRIVPALSHAIRLCGGKRAPF